MRRIVIGSMIRSGSTWVYNAARILAEQAGLDVYAERAEFYDPTNPAMLHVVKAHVFDESLLPATVVTTIRDMRDAVASAVRLKLLPYDTYENFGLTRLYSNINTRVVLPALLWTPHALHVIRYEDMVVDKPAALQSLAQSLFPETKFNIPEIAQQLEDLVTADNPPSYGYATEGKHCTNIGVGGYVDVLRPADVHMLTIEHRNWLVKFGYSLQDRSTESEDVS